MTRSVETSGRRTVQIKRRALSRFPRLIENFEAAPEGVYESGETISNYYDLSTGYFGRTQSDIVEGSYALESQNEAANQFIISEPGDGLFNYPKFDTTVAFLIREPSTDEMMPGFAYNGSKSNVSCYTAEIRADSNDMRFRRMDDTGNNYEELGNINVDLDISTWYWGEVDIPMKNGDQHEFRLYDLNEPNLVRGNHIATTTMTDEIYTDQIGIGAARHSTSGTGTFLDWIRVIR